MSWMQFFTWSIVLYGIYYGINILMDTMKSGRSSPATSDNVLHFSDGDEPPKTLQESDDNTDNEQAPALVVNKQPLLQGEAIAPAKVDNAVEGKGVSLKGLFDLARTEAIEFTKPVSFH